MSRFRRAADDAILHRFRALLLQLGGEGAKRLDHLARCRRERQVRRDQGPRLPEFPHQAVEALVGRPFQIARADPGPGKDLIQRLTVPGAVLADVQRQHVQAEHFHEANQIVERTGSRRLGTGPAQVGGQRCQVGE